MRVKIELDNYDDEFTISDNFELTTIDEENISLSCFIKTSKNDGEFYNAILSKKELVKIMQGVVLNQFDNNELDELRKMAMEDYDDSNPWDIDKIKKNNEEE